MHRQQWMIHTLLVNKSNKIRIINLTAMQRELTMQEYFSTSPVNQWSKFYMQFTTKSFRIVQYSKKISEWLNTFMNPTCHIYKAKQSTTMSIMWSLLQCQSYPKAYFIGTSISTYVKILCISTALDSSTPHPKISYFLREVWLKPKSEEYRRWDKLGQ